MATNGSKMHVNGRSRQDEASAPIIDDSLIAEDDEGLPLISAVFSLATNGKPEGTPVSGQSIIIIIIIINIIIIACCDDANISSFCSFVAKSGHNLRPLILRAFSKCWQFLKVLISVICQLRREQTACPTNVVNRY